jgi:hypothetical protein
LQHILYQHDPDFLRVLELSAVRFAAVADAENAHDVVILLEANAIVAVTETKLWRVDSLKPFHVAGARFGEAFDGLFDSTSDSLMRPAMSAKAVSVRFPEPFASFLRGEFVLLRFRFVIEGRVAQSRGDGIDNRFQKLHQAGELGLR